jgi:hemerythrin
MFYLEWNDDFLIGNGELDGHHMHLVDLLNRVYTTCMSHSSSDDLKKIVDELIDYVDYHFAAEERVMQEHDYPGLTEQKHEHGEFKQRLDRLKNAISDTHQFSTIESIELTQMLADWVKNHITDMDTKLGIHLRTT